MILDEKEHLTLKECAVAEMAAVGDEASEEFIAPGNLVPSLAFTQAEGSKVQSLDNKLSKLTIFQRTSLEPVQKSVTLIDLDMVRISSFQLQCFF